MRAVLLGLLSAAMAGSLRADSWSDAIEKLQAGDQAGAIQLLQSAIAAEPAASGPNVLLVEVLLGSQRVDEASRVAAHALAAGPKVAEFHRLSGDVRFRQGDIAGAEKEYRAAATIDPNDARAVLGMARIFQAASVNHNAELLLHKAHDLDPEDPAIEAALERAEPDTPASLARWEEFLRTAPPGSPDSPMMRQLRAHIAEARKLAGRPSAELVSPYAHYQIPLNLEHSGERSTGFGISLSVNGAKDELQLDTGASGLLISARLAERAGVQRLADVDLAGIGSKGFTRGWLGFAERVQIGDVQFRNCMVRVPEKGSVGEHGGLIGADLFQRFLVKLNFRKRRLELDPLPGAPWDGHSNVDRYTGPELTGWSPFFRLGHYVLIPTRIGDGPPVLFLLDTGSSFSMISSAAAPAVTKLRTDPRTRINGISGDVKGVYSADKVTLEFAHYRQVNQDITAFDLSGFSRSAGAEITGIMGLPLLTLFASVTVDYRDGRVLFDQKE